MIEDSIPKPKKCTLFGIPFLKYQDGTFFLKFENPMKQDIDGQLSVKGS